MVVNKPITITVTFTEAEVNQLAALLSAAVKEGGMPAAVVAVPIFNRLVEQLEKAKALEKPLF